MQDAALIDTVILGLRQFADFIGVLFIFRFAEVDLVCFPARQKSKWPAFRHHQAKDFAALFIDHIDGARRGGRAGNIQQAVTRRQVQQFGARAFQFRVRRQAALQKR